MHRTTSTLNPEPIPWDKDAVQVDDKLILHLAVYSWKVQAIRTTMPLCNPSGMQPGGIFITEFDFHAGTGLNR
jgi:hypothetical protein